jgi:hypothetical protein
MAVQVWIGEKPEHPQERRAIMALANGLDRLEGLYLLLANFNVGGRNVDLVIIKADAIFIIELKHCDGKVTGTVNGPWYVEGRNGEQKRLNPGRKNPYNQVISYFHALTNFLNEHRREFLSAQKSSDVDFRTCKRVVVIAPSLQGAEIELDWKVELKGLDDLPAYLVTERSSEIDLTEEEMLRIPELLHCSPWSEINAVVQGVLSPSSLLPADAAPAPPLVVETSPPAQVEPVAAAPVAPTVMQRVRGALTTTTGRIAATMSIVALCLLAVLVLRPAQIVYPEADELRPPTTVAGAPVASALPAGSGAVVAAEANCVWTGNQFVGKRYDAAAGSWTSVVVDGTQSTDNPEVLVVLEQVAYCDDEIRLTWSVRNESTRTIEFPLSNENIQISDGMGNDYRIADAESEPRVLVVAPGGEERGTAIVPRALSYNAASLRVRLKDEPFGEASFLVALGN